MIRLTPILRSFCFLALTALAGQAQTVTRLVVTPSPAFTIANGLPIQFHAIATTTNGTGTGTTQDVTSIATWTSDTPAVATVNAAGMATGITIGTATITATCGGRSTNALLNVQFASAIQPAAIATVRVGTNPFSIAVNPVTAAAYVVNHDSNDVTVIDGNNYTTATVIVGTAPTAVAINPATNRIYVANSLSNNVTIIDGRDNTTTTASAGTGPQAVAINAVTNKIYVANSGSFTVVDGASGNSTTIPLAFNLSSIATNPVTNRVYASYLGPQPGVLVIDGATNATISNVLLPATIQAPVLVVNTAANQIYATTPIGGALTVIDGVTNTATQPIVPSVVISVAVNAVVNKVIVAGSNASLFDPTTGTATLLPGSTTPVRYSVAAMNPVANQAWVAVPNTNTVGVLDGANGYAMTTSITVGSGPRVLAVNPVKNKIFVGNQTDNTVTVIDGAANTPAPLAPGSKPLGVAVNPLTNKTYVANGGSNNVTVIDGATGTATTVQTGTSPAAIDVDPLSNRIITANSGSDDITIIDGATNTATNLPMGPHPIGVAVNPQTGVVYIATSGNNSVTALAPNGFSTTIPVGTLTTDAFTFRMAFNQATNQIYVPAAGAGTVTVIDGAHNTTATINVGGTPRVLAVNPATGRLYVVNGTNSILAIDGNTITTIALTFSPVDVIVNPFTNRIYGLGAIGGTAVMAVVDGATNQAQTVNLPLSNLTSVLALDPVTNKIYAGSIGGTNNNGVISFDGEANAPILTGNTNRVGLVRAIAMGVNPATNRVYAVSAFLNTPGAVIAEENTGAAAAGVSITPLPADRTTSPMPLLRISAIASPVENVHYRFDTRAGTWTVAPRNPDGGFTATPATSLTPGLHVLLAFSTSNQAATLGTTGVGVGNGDSPLVSAIAAYPFFVAPGGGTGVGGGPVLTGIIVSVPAGHVVAGSTLQFGATGLYSDGVRRDITTQVAWHSSNPGAVGVGPGGVGAALTAGTANITASAAGLTGSMVVVVEAPLPAVVVTGAVASSAGGGWTAQLTVTNQGNLTVTGVRFTSALLNGTPSLTAMPVVVGLLTPGQSVSIPVLFPAAAATPASRAALQVQGSFTSVLPNGSTQPGAFSAGLRIVLP